MRALLPVAALLASAAILLTGHGYQMTGHGYQNVLVPVRAGIEDFAPFAIGVLGTFYFAGLTLGCLAGPWIVRRAGHIRTFAALAALASCVPLLHAMAPEPVSWTILRAFTGFCFAGLHMVIESWLNERAENATRGRILATYTMLNLLAVMTGQQILGVADPSGAHAFAIVAMLVALAVVPVALTTASAPSPPAQARLRLGWLIKLSPVAAIGCFGVGLANGTFWSLAPLFASAAGADTQAVAFFMGAVVLGGAVVQWPLGRLSDRFDRRTVIVGCCVAAALAGAALTAVAGTGVRGTGVGGLLPLAGLFGMGALPVYALCIAHANDHARPQDMVHVSGGLLLTFGLGAIIGPLVAGLVVERAGFLWLFAIIAIVHAVLALAVVIRMRWRAAVPPDEREPFVPVPRTTQAVFELDPRGGEAGDGDAEVPDPSLSTADRP